MEERSLSKSQKNEILRLIQKYGLNALDFEWKKETGRWMGFNVACLVCQHAGTNYYFKFDYMSQIDAHSEFFPGGDVEVKFEPVDSWLIRLSQVESWISFLKKEVEAPDLWEQLKGYAPYEEFIGRAEISNVPFSYSEAENIIGSLDKLQAQIEENFNLQGEQLAFVKREIDYLKDAAKRQGKKDWMHTSIGVIMTIAVGLVLSPEKAKLLWDLLKSCFAGILQLPAP